MEKQACIKKILVIDLAFIGDLILAGPVLRALQEEYPLARLTMLTMPLTADIAAMNPYVDTVLVYDKRGKHKGFFGMLHIAALLRRQNFDMAVCLNFAVRGAFVAWLAGIRQRIGYAAQHAQWFLTRSAPAVRDGSRHETENHLSVLQPLQIAASDTSLILCPPSKAKEMLSLKLTAWGLPDKGYLVFCPVGSYSRKNLPQAAVAGAVRYFQRKKPVYLIGGSQEGQALAAIAKDAGLPLLQVMAGTLSLPELTALLAGAEMLVTVDTGPLHIAQAVDCPVTSFFGPTDPSVWGPRGLKASIVYKKPSCSPCWGRGVCEADCLSSLTAHDIIEAAEALAVRLKVENNVS